MSIYEMIVCVAGKNNIAVEILEYLIRISQGQYELCVVCNEGRGEVKHFQKSLHDAAERNGVPIVSLCDTYEYDDLIFLSMEFDKIIKPSKFKNARLYNIHFSLLPAYKGMYTSAIPILNGERYSGVTFHRIDEGIDTGDIVAQKKFELKENYTCRELYLKYIEVGIDLVKECLQDVLSKKESASPQPFYGASYYPQGYIDYNNLKLNMKNVAVNVERQIRAYSFREYQMPNFKGTPIISCKITNTRSHGKPGTIVREDASLFEVTTIDYNVFLYKDNIDSLFHSCQCGDLITVKEICKVREHINVQDIHGWTPLIVATYNNCIEIVKYLIEIGANIRIKNHNNTNLLMYAKEAYKMHNDKTLFDLYRKMGADIHEKDVYGFSVVDYAKKDGLNELL